jgi:hypothetical protein
MENVLLVIEWIIEHAEGLLTLAVAVGALIKHFEAVKEKNAMETRKDKVRAIGELAPYIVTIVDDMVDLTGNEKAIAFMDKLEKALNAHGFEINEEDKEGLMLVGSGIHKEEQKLAKEKAEKAGLKL